MNKKVLVGLLSLSLIVGFTLPALAQMGTTAGSTWSSEQTGNPAASSTDMQGNSQAINRSAGSSANQGTPGTTDQFGNQTNANTQSGQQKTSFFQKIKNFFHRGNTNSTASTPSNPTTGN